MTMIKAYERTTERSYGSCAADDTVPLSGSNEVLSMEFEKMQTWRKGAGVRW